MAHCGTHLPAGNLQLQAQVSLAPGPGSGVPCPATSLLWVGPALLYLTTSGNVMQVRVGVAFHIMQRVAGGLGGI